MATNVWEAIKDKITSIWDAIKSAITTAVEIVKTVLSTAWNAIKTTAINVWNAIETAIENVWTAIKTAITNAVEKVKTILSNAWNAIKTTAAIVWGSIETAIENVWTGIKTGITNAVNSVKTTVSDVFNSIKTTATNVWNGIKDAILKPIEAAKDTIKGIVNSIEGFFSNMKIKLPDIKLPHFKLEGEFSLSPPSVPHLAVDWYKEGGILTQPTVFGASGNRLLAGGEAGAEAVLPLAVLWEKMESILRKILTSQSTTTTGETSGEGLTSKAGELLTLDDFSLGSLANSTNVMIYYDFSGFTWSPQFQTNGTGDNEDDLMARLKAHEAEFFDWLEEFIQMREVAQYA